MVQKGLGNSSTVLIIYFFLFLLFRDISSKKNANTSIYEYPVLKTRFEKIYVRKSKSAQSLPVSVSPSSAKERNPVRNPYAQRAKTITSQAYLYNGKPPEFIVQRVLNSSRVLYYLYPLLNSLPDNQFTATMDYLYPTVRISLPPSISTSTSSNGHLIPPLQMMGRYFAPNQPTHSSPLSQNDILNRHATYPDPSFNWMKWNKTYALNHSPTWGTYLLQQAIWSHQHPKDCSEHKMARVLTQHSGFGSELHETASYVSYVMSLGYVATYDPRFASEWMRESDSFTECISEDRHIGFLCVFEDISHCPKSRSYVPYSHVNDTLIYQRHYTIPSFALEILHQSPYPQQQYMGIWMAQITAYVTRVRPFMVDRLNEMMRQSVKCTFPYAWDRPLDVSMHIRHGDKKQEMMLIPTENYVDAIVTMERYLKRKITVFVSSDDPYAVDVLRRQLPDQQLCYVEATEEKRQRNIQFFMFCLANLKMAAECTHQIGTYHSNVCRLIEELQVTVGGQSNHVYLEVGRFNYFPITESMRPYQRIVRFRFF